MEIYSLNGTWNLKGKPQNSNDDFIELNAKVPGMVQLDLSASGFLPEDLYFGENIRSTEKFEKYEWWYERIFTAPKKRENIFLIFHGVDCIAEYFLNDEKIGESKNMFIPFEFDVSNKLFEGDNKLCVHIKSPVIEMSKYDFELSSMFGFEYDKTSVGIRRPAHSYGWDIMPRALTSGLWRDVTIEVRDPVYFKNIYLTYVETNQCKLFYGINSKFYDLENVEIEISGVCDDSTFYKRFRVTSPLGNVYIPINKSKFWWPYGYGDANLYDVTAKIYSNGDVIHINKFKYGHRFVSLQRTEETDGIEGQFSIKVNNTEIMCKGSNWVPLDAFHSRDRERYGRALSLVKDIGCNILRCWGGNVYEDSEFFDFCDENGIMVWQDFAMACAIYPQTEDFLEQMRKEATIVVKQLRQHPSLVLWSGDNEIDLLYRVYGIQPSKNKITREIIPNVIQSNDTERPYLPSSPYLSDKLLKDGRKDKMPEDHLWGSRDYFKSDYYKNSKAHFVSETGYHGCPSLESVKKFITSDNIWPFYNSEWILHSSDQRGNPGRISIMERQVKQLFGDIPKDPEEFILASQISQAEALKYFIERMRVGRPKKTGIIWWNILDGWPQISEAIVDYYFVKKLAYNYIKRSQAPFALVSDEISDWNLSIYACNDTLNKVNGTYWITDADTMQEIKRGEFFVEENTISKICSIPIYYSEKRMLLLNWDIDGQRGFNHYFCGYPPFDLQKYVFLMKKANL